MPQPNPPGPPNPPKPPNPPGPPEPRPHPQQGRKRRIEFASSGVGATTALRSRLLSQGISYDVIPRPGQETLIRAIAEPDKHGKASLPDDLAKGLGVKVVADETDPE